MILGAKGRDGATPLHLACSWGGPKEFLEFQEYQFRHLATINLLLECGAPVDTRDNDGNTALHTAALYHPVEAGIISVVGGARPNQKTKQFTFYINFMIEGQIYLVFIT